MRTVDLFCGCGGLSLGFLKAGFEVLAGLDNWDDALTVYRQNFKHPAIKCDLSNEEEAVELIKPLNPDIIIGGPPCQDFSSAGKRNEDNGRGDLTVSYAKIVSKVRPTWFVMENVARIVKTQKLVDAISIFKEAGYGVSYEVLNASLCGVPQKRKRFVMIGKLGVEDGYIKKDMLAGLSEREMTVADYFGNRLGIQYYYRHPRSYVRRGIFSVDEPSPTIRGVNRPIPKNYQLNSNDPVSSLDGIRALTQLERAMIQTFPENFCFSGSKTDQEQMIGNAVPVNLGKYVGSVIMKKSGLEIKDLSISDRIVPVSTCVEQDDSEKELDFEETLKSFPETIVDNTSFQKSNSNQLVVDGNRNVLISLVKSDNVEQYLDRSARIYYTGKKFPSSVALNKLFYFMPYLKGKGVKDLYFIKIARVGTRKEGQLGNDPNDFRLVFEIEYVGELFEDYKNIDLNIWHTFKDLKMKDLI